jgi:hypothetical protein
MKHNDDQCSFHSRRSGPEAIDIGIKGVSGRYLKRSRALTKGEVGMNSEILLYHNILGGQPASYENMIVFSIAGHRLTAGAEPALG